VSDAPSDPEISVASLPPAVRDRIGRVVGVALPDLAPADVPAGLRHLLRFTPAKRRRLGTDLVAAAVCEQPRFRAALVELLNTSSPEVLDLESEDPVAAATAALLRTDPQAQQHMARAGELDELQALRGELSSVRRRLQRTERERDRWAAELAAHQATATEEAASAAEEEAQRLRTRLASRAGDCGKPPTPSPSWPSDSRSTRTGRCRNWRRSGPPGNGTGVGWARSVRGRTEPSRSASAPANQRERHGRPTRYGWACC